MKKLFFILSIIILSASFFSCTGKQDKKERVITVTIEPLRYFAEQIAGDKFKIISMVPKGSSPETYDPTPLQLTSLAKSEAYFRIGYIGFELMWMDKLTGNAPQMQIFDTSKGINLIEDKQNHEESENGDHHHGGIEPHVWNSPANVLILADNIYKAFCKLDSKNSDYYAMRLQVLKKEVVSTDKEIKGLLKNSQKAFIIYHPALSYFARDYGLKQLSIEERGKEPTPAHLKSIIQDCEREKIKTIFVQKEFDGRNAELIATETGTKLVHINPLSYNWKKEMINIAKALKNE